MDGWAWVAVWPLVVIVAVAVLFTSPAQAQTVDEPAAERLGEELYPPTGYPTVESDGVVEVGRYDIGCSNGGFIGDVACITRLVSKRTALPPQSIRAMLLGHSEIDPELWFG